MNDWFPTQRLRRHAVQASFEALPRKCVTEVAAWRDREGLGEVVAAVFGEPRRALIEAAAARAVDPGPLIRSWTHALAERSVAGRTPERVLDWFLDRPRIWIEGEIRHRHGRAILAAIRTECARHGERAADRLLLDASLAATVLAALDTADRYDPERPVESWLAGIARYTARDLCRVEEVRTERLPRASLDPAEVASRGPSATSLFEAAEERAWVVGRALQGRPLPGEDVIIASVLDGDRSAASVGSELSMSVKRVYKRTASARARLRDAMEKLAGR